MPEKHEHDRPPRPHEEPDRKKTEPIDFTEFEQVEEEVLEFREEEGE